MLADELNAARQELLADVERAADATEGTELPATARGERLKGLLDELINALRRGAIVDHVPPPASLHDREIDRNERELLRRHVLEGIGRAELAATPAEIAIVAEWVCNIEGWRLRELNRQLTALLAGVDESTALVTPDTRILFVNDRGARMLHDASGVSPEELIGRTIKELAIPEEIGFGRIDTDILSLGRTHDKYDSVVGGRAKENHFDAVYSADGALSAIAVVVRDVQAETISNHRVALLSRLGGLVGTLDYDDVAEALSHVPIPELADWCMVNLVEDRRIHRTFVAHRDPSMVPLRDALMQLFPSLDRHPLWQNMLTGGYQLLSEVTDDLIRRVSLDPETYRVLSQLQICSLLVMPVASRGQVAGIITLAYTAESMRRYGRDDPGLAEELALHAGHLIEAARLMKALKASEARFHIALAGARTTVYEQDRTLGYTYYYSPSTRLQPIGQQDSAIVPPDQAAHLHELKAHVLDTGESAFEELDLSMSGESLRHYRCAIEAERDHSGRIVGVIGASTDITEQQLARQQLTELVVLRERMAGVLGHDLRNPLTTVRMGVESLVEREDLPADAHSQLARIASASLRMQEMIDTLLDFTRARSLGSIPISPVPTDVSELARAVVDEVQSAWPKRTIQLECRGDPHVVWDPGRMAQVISNLIINALTYGDPSVPVEVLVEATADPVVVTVHNTGPVIPPEILPVLFEPFRRGAVDRSPHGLGLGLYIVEQLVKAHDGTVTVQSTTQEGTTFTVRLPRSPHAASAAATIH
jgi:signal transduction histidine kinase